jgi:acetyl-CoA carboxylase carboxyltransferase component
VAAGYRLPATYDATVAESPGSSGERRADLFEALERRALTGAEATALVRHCSRLFVTGAALRVPFVAVILRKAYGLGAQAMAAGSLHEPLLTVGWPTAELGPMGLEGAVRLGFRRELDTIPDENKRERRVQELTAAAHERANALNAATLFELDDVIDPRHDA